MEKIHGVPKVLLQFKNIFFLIYSPATKNKFLEGRKYFRGGQITYTGIMYYNNQYFLGGKIFFRGGGAPLGCGSVN